MLNTIHNTLRILALEMSEPEGEVKTKLRATPKVKPPRRNPDVENKSNRSDYMKNYMTKYREEGKSYQKMPDKLKEYRRKQRKRLRDKYLKKQGDDNGN
jgi:hypothetical protein